MKHEENADAHDAPTEANASETGTGARNTQTTCTCFYHATTIKKSLEGTFGKNLTTNQLKSVESRKNLEII